MEHLRLKGDLIAGFKVEGLIIKERFVGYTGWQSQGSRFWPSMRRLIFRAVLLSDGPLYQRIGLLFLEYSHVGWDTLIKEV